MISAGTWGCKPCKIHGQFYTDVMECFVVPYAQYKCGCYTPYGDRAYEAIHQYEAELQRQKDSDSAFGYAGPVL